MDASPLQNPSSWKATLPLILKAIRRHRGLRSSEVARAMGMRLRTYQHFESGRAGLNLERIHQFADAVNADGYAIVMALDIGSVEFALCCLENKASTVFLVSLQRFANKAGKDIARLDPRSFISAFDRVFDELTTKAREHDAVLEGWMMDRSLGGEPPETEG